MSNSVQLYARLVGVSVRAQMQYRASFFMTALGQFVGSIIEAAGIWALFDRFGALPNWSLAQVAMFYGVVNVSFAISDALARGFDVFGNRFVKTGEFDRLLLRPRSSFLLLAGYEFTLHRVGRLLQGLLILGWAIHALDIDWSLIKMGRLLFTVLSGAVFFYALVVIQATLSFWATESLEIMNSLTYGGMETAQYPLSIYQASFRRFFTLVIPLACVTYFPVVGIMGISDPLGSGEWFQALAPLAGFVFFAIAYLIWQFGVRHYTSTGS